MILLHKNKLWPRLTSTLPFHRHLAIINGFNFSLRRPNTKTFPNVYASNLDNHSNTTPSTMMMDFQKHPPQPIHHSHPSAILGATHDPRLVAPPPPRAYAPPPPPSARAYYDAYNRREHEMPRAVPVYHYPTTTAASIPASSASYAHESVSTSYRTESNGYHVSQANPSSMRKHTLDGGLKESNNRHNFSYNVNQLNNHDRRMVYREGRKHV